MITDYASLQSDVGDFLNRADLSAQIPTFIQLAEASINRSVRHWEMVKRARATSVGQYLERPDDWVETIRLNVVGKRPLRMLSHIQMADMRGSRQNAVGEAAHYANVGSSFEILPTPSDATEFEVTYYAAIPALSDASTSNWLLDKSPDAYLYGALVHTAPYLQEDPRLTVWGGLYRDVIDGLNREGRRAQHSGSGLARR